MVHGYLDFARGEGTEDPVETDISLLIEDVAAAMRREGTPLSVAAAGRMCDAGQTECAAPLPRQLDRQCAPSRQPCLAAGRRRSRTGSISWSTMTGRAYRRPIAARVFQPFVRLDASRNPSTGGVGLGLTIARDVARSHGGDVRLETSPHGGLRARVHLPR